VKEKISIYSVSPKSGNRFSDKDTQKQSLKQFRCFNLNANCFKSIEMLFEPSELGKEKAWIGMRPIQAFLFLS
jgi:hypothetical protein